MEEKINKPLPPKAMVFGEPKATFKSSKDKVLIADEGMVYVREVAVRAWRWDELKTASIEKLESRGGNIRHACTIITNQEEKLRFRDEFDGIEEMGRLIVKHVLAVIEPGIRARLDAGEWVEFGRDTKPMIALHKTDGVRVNGRTDFAWDEVNYLERNGFFFRLYTQDGKGHKLDYVPQHIELLKVLIDELNHD